MFQIHLYLGSFVSDFSSFNLDDDCHSDPWLTKKMIGCVMHAAM
jgi:hypothetical protein